MNRKASVTAGVAAMVVALAACEGAEVKPVEGLRDDLKYAAPVYKVRQVDVKQRRCESKVEKTKTGTKTVNKCKDVKVGTRSETYQAKPAKWCVELDRVNGDGRNNDQWFTVDQGTHQLASETVEGKSIKFTPLAEGC